MRWVQISPLLVFWFFGCSSAPSSETGSNKSSQGGHEEHVLPNEGQKPGLKDDVQAGQWAPATGNSSREWLEKMKASTALINERTEMAELTKVRHILLGWRQLSPAYRGKMDPRAAERDRVAADELMSKIVKELSEGKAFSALMKTHSEDGASLKSEKPYVITPTAGFVPPFKEASLRLKKDERALVESVYGWHLIERVE